jgi:hypothetical protein
MRDMDMLNFEGRKGVGKQKISHRKLLLESQSFGDLDGSLVNRYRQKVCSQKTRIIRLIGRKSTAKIIHTLLGYELQASYKRIHCPDLVTAQYLKIFSDLGCHSIHLPYDPTVTAQLIPEFEILLENINRKVRETFPKNTGTRQYVIQKIYEIIRQQLKSS